MTRRQNRTFVALKMPTKVPDYIALMRSVIAAATNNSSLPDARPLVAGLRAAVEKLAARQVSSLTRAVGTASARDEAFVVARQAMQTYQQYVQQKADADPEEAASIITGAGLRVRLPSSRRKSLFAARPGLRSGEVVLEAKAPSKRTRYEWEASSDGGQTWVSRGKTLQSKTTIDELPVGEYAHFRYRVLTKDGLSDWSDPLEVLVK
jgi:hypothetical protein